MQIPWKWDARRDGGWGGGGGGLKGRIESWVTIINVAVDTSNASTDDVLKFSFPRWMGLQCFILPNTI